MGFANVNGQFRDQKPEHNVLLEFHHFYLPDNVDQHQNLFWYISSYAFLKSSHKIKKLEYLHWTALGVWVEHGFSLKHYF